MKKRLIVEELSDYLAAMRTEVARHGRDKVDYKPDGNSMIGFESPDGWWLIRVLTVKVTCAEENASKRHKVTGRYARRASPEAIFVDWFSAKLQKAVEDGERLRAGHGLS